MLLFACIVCDIRFDGNYVVVLFSHLAEHYMAVKPLSRHTDRFLVWWNVQL